MSSPTTLQVCLMPTQKHRRDLGKHMAETEGEFVLMEDLREPHKGDGSEE